MMILRTLRRVDSRTPAMAVLPWRTTENTERDAPRTQFGIMPVIEDQITTPPAGIMPVMQVIEAQRTSILVPHDHLHNNQMSAWLAGGCTQ